MLISTFEKARSLTPQHCSGMPGQRPATAGCRLVPAHHAHTHTHTTYASLTPDCCAIHCSGIDGWESGFVYLRTHTDGHTQWGRSSWFGPKVQPPGDKSCRAQYTCCTTTKLPHHQVSQQGVVFSRCMNKHHVSSYCLGLTQLRKNPS